MTRRPTTSLNRHTAFTTIELLVAMAIVVILAGMVFVGYRVIGTGGKTRATRSTLETARSLLTEVDVNKGGPYIKRVYNNPPPGAWIYYYAFPPLPAKSSSNIRTPVAKPLSAPNDPTPVIPTPIDAPFLTATASGNVSEDAFSSTHNIRFESLAVVRTQMMMQRILSISANRTTLGQLPAGSFLTWSFGTPPPINQLGKDLVFQLTQATPQKYQPSPGILVDSWGNPIIYVPPAGMRGVYFADDPTHERVITSVRVRDMYAAGTDTPNPNPSLPNYFNFDPGATGFWASAGPDGDFTKGDDNIYSFEGL